MKKLILMTIVLLSSAFSQASLVEIGMLAKLSLIEAGYKQCLNGSVDMAACAYEANSAYRDALAAMSNEMISMFSDDNNSIAKLAKLAVSEKEWADYVQTTCSLKYVDMTEDSAYGMLLTQCENDKIVERINELIKIYNTFLSLN